MLGKSSRSTFGFAASAMSLFQATRCTSGTLCGAAFRPKVHFNLPDPGLKRPSPPGTVRHFLDCSCSSESVNSQLRCI